MAGGCDRIRKAGPPFAPEAGKRSRDPVAPAQKEAVPCAIQAVYSTRICDSGAKAGLVTDAILGASLLASPPVSPKRVSKRRSSSQSSTPSWTDANLHQRKRELAG